MERDGLQQFMEHAQHRVLSREEERALAVRARAGDKQAADELALHNVRLVYSIARRYVPGPLPLDDLMQEGMLGLLHAVTKFDPDKGFKFSTYATWWIKQAVQRAIHGKARVIRLPVHQAERLDRMHRHMNRLALKLGRDPTDDELAQSANLTLGQIKELREIRAHTLSLDGFVDDDGETIGVEVAHLDDEPDFADHMVEQANLHDALAQLPERDRRVIELRYGFGDGEEQTLEAIGKELGITRERVRQIETRALDVLRALVAA